MSLVFVLDISGKVFFDFVDWLIQLQRVEGSDVVLYDHNFHIILFSSFFPEEMPSSIIFFIPFMELTSFAMEFFYVISHHGSV